MSTNRAIKWIKREETEATITYHSCGSTWICESCLYNVRSYYIAHQHLYTESIEPEAKSWWRRLWEGN